MAQRLAGELAGGIRGNSPKNGVAFRKRNLCIDAIDGGGRGNHELADVVPSGAFEDIHSAFNIHALIQCRILETGPNARASGKMHHLVELRRRKQTFNVGSISDITFDKLEVASPALQPLNIPQFDLRIIKVIKIINAPDSVPHGEESLTKIRTDKSGGAGDQYIHQTNLPYPAR